MKTRADPARVFIFAPRPRPWHSIAVMSDIAALEAELARIRAVAAEFADAVRASLGARVKGITLYGSAARGDWGPDSDVDLLVLLDHRTPEDADVIARHAVEFGLLGSGLLLQPLILPEAEFDLLRRRERRLALDILREGIPL